MGILRPSNSLSDFHEIRTLELFHLKTTHHAKFQVDPTTWVVSANTQFATVRLLSLSFFLFWSLRHAHRAHQWTDFGDDVLLPKDVPFGAFVDMHRHLGVKSPKSILGRE